MANIDVVRSFNGKWLHNQESALLSISSDAGTEEYEVVELTSKILVIKSKVEGGLFQSLYLKKKS